MSRSEPKQDSPRIESILRPYDQNHSRYFDFREFKSLGLAFISAFSLNFILHSSSVALCTAQDYYGAAQHLFRWLISNQMNLIRLVSTLQIDHTKASAKDWEDAIALWRDDLQGKPKPGPITKYKLIKNVNVLLRRMAGFGVIPKLTYVKAPQKLRLAGRPTRSLAELQPQGIHEANKENLEEALLGIKGTDVDLQIRRDFLATLLSETGKIAGSAEEHAKILMKVNADRLAAIRMCASIEFKKWRDYWLEGQRLLKSCDMSFEEMKAIVQQQSPSKISGKQGLAALFPKDNTDVSLPRLLKYANEHTEYLGRLMWLPEGKLDHLFEYQVILCGGLEAFQAYLLPHRYMAMAVIIIFLCDTGANVSVARTLPCNCLENSKESGYKIFKGIKMRAGGKLIVDELPIRDSLHDLSCIDAIQTYQKASEQMRRLAAEKFMDNLFLCVGKSGLVKGIDGLKWNRWFRAFCNRHAELRDLNVQAKMIRPSVLMQATYDKESGIIAAAAIGDHVSMATTQGYVNRFPNQVIWERMIREFQSLFQAVSIHSIKGAAKKLGLSTKQVKNLLSEAHRTGLGVVCLNPKSGIQPDSKKGETCTQLQNCPDCPNRIVIATVDNLKDVILWNHHLEQCRLEWETSRPERWGRVWLPWLVFTQVIIEQASRGRMVIEFKKAKALAEEQIAKGKVNLGPLW